MKSALFQTEQWVNASLDRTFRFFADPQNLSKISPPWSGARLLEARLVLPPPNPYGPGNREVVPNLAGAGSEIVVSFFWFPYLPIRASWTARIVEFEWNRYFRDIQIRGPFRLFDHNHSFEQSDRNERPGTLVRDTISYDVGLAAAGRLLNASVIRMQLAAMFRYRQRATAQLLKSAERSL